MSATINNFNWLMHLRQPGLIYTASGKFAQRNEERIQYSEKQET